MEMYWTCLFHILVALTETRALLLGSTEETLSQMFSTYDITIPVQVDEAGNFLSHNLKDVYRKKRSAEEFVGDNNTTNYDEFQNEKQSNIYFNFTAFGVSYNVELQNKRRLIAPGAKFVRYLSNGSVESLINDKEVYTGRVRNEDQSSVAMTSFDGLAGYIKTEKGEFFIEPLDKRNDDDAKNPQRHVVYEKRDLIYKRGGEGNAQRKSIFEESESLMQNSQFLDASHENDGEKRYKRHSNKKKVYNIEVLLTADSTVADFHGTRGVKDYLITLMNIVDEIYHDETIGHVINIVIVQLSLLNGKDSKNLIAHEDPAVSLKNVCKWAHDMYNADRNRSDSSYDHAIFLTRQKFGPTGMEGYAHVTGMCRPLRSCTLNHEDGFSSAFVVAHETGHVLGMEHDGEGNKCGIETSMGSIMAPLVQAAFHRYHWSRCSQYELKGNIRKFHCLLNNPHVPDWGLTPEYPGVYYSMNDQCRFDFGPGYKQCTAFQIDNVCRTLWCSHDDNPMYCKTKNGPPVDGTACAENMWCFKSHCVWRNNMQGAINGAWGTWSNYGICSRSCGTGVMSRSRECNRPKPAYGGKNCRGISVEYGLCNKQKCTGAYDYRAEQCRYHQKKQYANRRHTWLPYENEMEDLKCELFCVSKETTTILSMGSPVADGTRCSYDDPYSICINAECMKVGCDGIIGSSKRDDECGVCDGDGSQCRKVASTYRKIVRKPFKSYMKTFTIPANARQVQIREATDTPTDILALKNRRTGRYVLNHKGSVIEGDLTKQFIDSETKWNYSRKRDREILSTRGPLSVDYLLMVVVRNRVKSKKIRINYSYVIHSSYTDNKMYQYAIRKWYPCSVTCGEGTRLARYGCRNKATKNWVRKTYCPASPPKRHRERCSMDCEPQPRWNIGRWESCSKTCGGVGQKVRKVNCQKKNKVGNSKTVDDAECNNISAKPIAQKPCTAPTCPPEWTVGNWSLCSVSCGKGTRLRSVVCISRGREVAVDKCLGEKPENLDYCHMPRCTSCESNHSETLCNLKSMAKFCSIAGYQRLCCATCRSRFGEFTGESRENKTTKRNSSRSPRSVTALIADDIPSG